MDDSGSVVDAPSDASQPLGVAALDCCSTPHACDDGDALLAAYQSELPPGALALYALDAQLRASGQSRSAFYQAIAQAEALLSSSAPTRAHVDSGSMATTTNNADILWHYTAYPSGSKAPVLKVADDYEHRPVGEGYLRVPVDNDHGYQMVKCFLTPSLPATIVSPDALGRQLGCRGYTSVSWFDGSDCFVHLHHCHWTSQDLQIPLTLVRGLLYSQPLILPPTELDHTLKRCCG